MKSLLFILFLFVPISLSQFKRPVFNPDTCSCGEKYLAGKVRVVTIGEDFKVRVVELGEDLKVIKRELLFNNPACGDWQFVDIGEDFKVRFVELGEDFSIRFSEL